MKTCISAMLGFLVLSACASKPSKPIFPGGRGLASIDNLPQPPAHGYFPSSSIVEFYSQEKAAGAFDEMFFDETADFYPQLNGELQKIALQIRQMLHNESVPLPKLVITRNPSINAFVAPKADCMRFDAVFHGLKNPTGKRMKDVFNQTLEPINHGSEFGMVGTGQSCAAKAEDASAVRSYFVDRTIHSPIGECRLRPGTSAVVFDCPEGKIDFNMPAARIAKTTPFVYVNAGLLESIQTMDEFRAVIAHELGHYYLGHAFTLTASRRYFYDRNQADSAFRPAEDQSLRKDGEKLLTIGNLQQGRTMPGVFSQAITGRTMAHLLDFFGAEEDHSQWKYDRSKCQPLIKKIASDVFDNDISKAADRFLFNPDATAEDVAKGQKVMLQIKSCLATLTAKSEKDASYQDLFYIRSSDTMKTFIDFNKMGKFANAWEAFKKVDEVIARQIEDMHSRLDLAYIGYYTEEEEADVFAANYLLSVGRTQADLQDALADFGRGARRNSPTSAAEVDACLEAYQNHWTLNGKPYMPMPTDFSDAHHGFCFRLYNMDYLRGRMGTYSLPPRMQNASNTGDDYTPIRDRYKQISQSLRKAAKKTSAIN